MCGDIFPFEIEESDLRRALESVWPDTTKQITLREIAIEMMTRR
ncbi:hypothetical protein PBCVAN69C_779R [Paramecium bursaria Chlorella virus AN69C]|uniref:Uncharacterized protein n=1 Tax=Paramecium bursaria Chlorella virus IL3A TaxID=46019 RepID=M1I6F4_PBCVI|nr:hypothetical protein PBCVAN69C_779R [Paramecium bursaria Chlorella virus AN69C]AGE54070.1 hypothetical protein PBCVIL3A_767R [Paramecium bursaria Chlorella virus IL3A]AGE57499.1 hypothetical protein PBCVNEJV4_778R [Paramecium bursaria Chlorella virus NE-JV-4]